MEYSFMKLQSVSKKFMNCICHAIKETNRYGSIITMHNFFMPLNITNKYYPTFHLCHSIKNQTKHLNFYVHFIYVCCEE